MLYKVPILDFVFIDVIKRLSMAILLRRAEFFSKKLKEKTPPSFCRTITLNSTYLDVILFILKWSSAIELQLIHIKQITKVWDLLMNWCFDRRQWYFNLTKHIWKSKKKLVSRTDENTVLSTGFFLAMVLTDFRDRSIKPWGMEYWIHF